MICSPSQTFQLNGACFRCGMCRSLWAHLCMCTLCCVLMELRTAALPYCFITLDTFACAQYQILVVVFILWPPMPVGFRLYPQGWFYVFLCFKNRVHLAVCPRPQVSVRRVPLHPAASQSRIVFFLQIGNKMPFLWATRLVSLAALGEGSVVLHGLALSALAGRGVSVLFTKRIIKKKRVGGRHSSSAEWSWTGSIKHLFALSSVSPLMWGWGWEKRGLAQRRVRGGASSSWSCRDRWRWRCRRLGHRQPYIPPGSSGPGLILLPPDFGESKYAKRYIAWGGEGGWKLWCPQIEWGGLCVSVMSNLEHLQAFYYFFFFSIFHFLALW